MQAVPNIDLGSQFLSKPKQQHCFFSFLFFQLDSRAHQFHFKFYLDDKFVKLAPSKHLATPVTRWRQSPWWGQQVPFPFYLWMSDFMSWERVYPTPGKHSEPDWTEMLPLQFVILMEGDLISSIVRLRQLRLPERIYPKETQIYQRETQNSWWLHHQKLPQSDSSRSVGKQPQFWPQSQAWPSSLCGLGDSGPGATAASLGCGQGTVVPLTDAPSPVDRGKWSFPTTHREAAKIFTQGEKKTETPRTRAMD